MDAGLAGWDGFVLLDELRRLMDSVVVESSAGRSKLTGRLVR